MESKISCSVYCFFASPGRVFGPLDFSRRDLMAVNIQRGRDHGLPDYQTARESLGLRRVTSVMDIIPQGAEYKSEDYRETTVPEGDVYTGVANEVSIFC